MFCVIIFMSFLWGGGVAFLARLGDSAISPLQLSLMTSHFFLSLFIDHLLMFLYYSYSIFYYSRCNLNHSLHIHLCIFISNPHKLCCKSASFWDWCPYLPVLGIGARKKKLFSLFLFVVVVVEPWLHCCCVVNLCHNFVEIVLASLLILGILVVFFNLDVIVVAFVKTLHPCSCNCFLFCYHF